MIEGATMIERGWADVVIAGGTGSRMTLNSMLYRGTKSLSRKTGDPTKASRPFDSERDGMVVGEGAGAIVLESQEHAIKRGAKPIAELVGWSRTHAAIGSEAYSKRIASCYQQCLQVCRPKIKNGAIGHLNAHAAGLVDRDVQEGRAIQEVLPGVPVTAMKGNFGNLGPGTSVIETAGSLLALQQNQLPKTLNLTSLDSELEGLNVVNTDSVSPGETFLKSSLSFTGQIASAVFKKSQ